MLIQILVNMRQDKKTKIVTNTLLSKLESLQELIIAVDNMSRKPTKISLIIIDESLQNKEFVIFSLLARHHTLT